MTISLEGRACHFPPQVLLRELLRQADGRAAVLRRLVDSYDIAWTAREYGADPADVACVSEEPATPPPKRAWAVAAPATPPRLTCPACKSHQAGVENHGCVLAWTAAPTFGPGAGFATSWARRL